MSLVRLTGSLTLGSAGQQIAPNLDGACVVDFSDTSFIDAYAIVLAALDVSSAIQRGHEVEIRGPESDSVANYLARMHLGAFFDENGIGHSLPDVRESDHDGFLIELRRLSGRAFEILGDLVASRMSDVEDVDAEVVISVSEAIFELGANTLEHSRSETAYLAAQVYRRNTPYAYVVGAIGDVGIGLMRSLERHTPANDREAITLAATEGISGTGDVHRGLGLSTLAEACQSLQGTLAIRSGESERLIYSGSSTSLRGTDLPGTLVGFRIPLKPGRRRR